GQDGAAYTFRDTNPGAATVFYRLRSVDWDGSEQFSEVLSVHNTAHETRFLARTQVQSGDRVPLSAPGPRALTWQLVDTNGRLLRRGITQESGYLRTDGLSPGCYFFSAAGKTERLLIY
ncbi:MAG: hypothetical protein AAFN92_21715, partial [Bacteroidota bacterium]